VNVKICGISRDRDVELLARLPVDHVGLWYGVPGGHADLALPTFLRLGAAVQRSRSLLPVLVTLSGDAEALAQVVRASGVRRVQLHGYQTPAMISALKASAPDGLWILKGLHVRGRACTERPSLIRAYEKAGVDAFLVDASADDGRVGSTGRSLEGDTVWSLVEEFTLPFLLAGGISAQGCAQHQLPVHHPRFLGIDLDTNARGPDGRLCPHRIEAVSHAWRSCHDEGQQHARQLH
jgi:phosphoribosylanthranilate isomerase